MKKALLLVVMLFLVVSNGRVFATVLASPHYRLDPNSVDSFGGQTGSANYKLTDAGGEAAIGNSSSSSYRESSGFISNLSQSLQVSILPTGIAAYYPLDTGQGGQVYDVSANNNQGSLVATPTWTAGKLNGALALNGVNQYVTIPSSSSLNLTGDMSMSAWVNLSDLTVQHELLAKRVGTGASNTTYELRIQQTTGLLQFISYDASLKTITSTTAVPTGTWAQVAVIKKAGSVTLYLNGAAISSATTIGTPTTNTSDLKIGTTDDLANFMKGSIDEIKLYSRALTVTELTADVAAVNGGVATTAAIPNIVPGSSQTISSDVIVRTDAPGYSLALAENHDLLSSDTVTTIPGSGGSIAAPTAWTEGTTKGLGFTLTGGTGLETSWGTNPNYNYAALPTVSTTFHTRTGFSGGAADTTTMQYRLDTAINQKSGSYTNTATITATQKL
jgi:hypothetical protein